jgi:hypothetical protein
VKKQFELSDNQVDFGRVPTRYTVRHPLTLVNRGTKPVEITSILIDSPFQVSRTSLTIAPGSRGWVDVTFRPEKAGSFEGRAEIHVGGPVNQVFFLALRGQGVLSPQDAGVSIPPPPDAAALERRQRETERILAEAREWEQERAARQAAGEDTGDEGTATQKAARSGGPAGVIPYPVVLAAFGEQLDPTQDSNRIPVPIPEGDTQPELKDEADEGDPNTSGGNNAARRKREDPEVEAKKLKGFIIAPNSSILVHSAEEAIDLQTFPVHFGSDGSSFRVDGRIRFPELSLAFDQHVGLQQWGNLTGVLLPDGSMEVQMTLRLHDPNEAVLDLPVQLTTGMAVGYSTGGRLMFANGIPRSSSSGDFKLVGVTNIPIGTGSSLERAPIYIELLGRLEI